MKSVLTGLLAAAAVSIVAAPALAKASEKGADARPVTDRQNEVPPGLLKAAERASPQVGHGDDVPRGNGHGWGHVLHDHEETPVSP